MGRRSQLEHSARLTISILPATQAVGLRLRWQRTIRDSIGAALGGWGSKDSLAACVTWGEAALLLRCCAVAQPVQMPDHCHALTRAQMCCIRIRAAPRT